MLLEDGGLAMTRMLTSSKWVISSSAVGVLHMLPVQAGAPGATLLFAAITTSVTGGRHAWAKIVAFHNHTISLMPGSLCNMASCKSGIIPVIMDGSSCSCVQSNALPCTIPLSIKSSTSSPSF